GRWRGQRAPRPTPERDRDEPRRPRAGGVTAHALPASASVGGPGGPAAAPSLAPGPDRRPRRRGLRPLAGRESVPRPPEDARTGPAGGGFGAARGRVIRYVPV